MITSQHMIALYKYAPTRHFTGQISDLASKDFIILPLFDQIYPDIRWVLAKLAPQFKGIQSQVDKAWLARSK